MAAKRTERFPIMLTPQEVADIEGFRWKHRIKTQASAVRNLIEKGLAADAAKSEGPVAPTTSPSKATE